MGRKIKSLAALFLIFAFAGCIQTKEEYTLNPDGSGKVVYEVTMPMTNPFSKSKDSNPADQAKNQVDKMLKESAGVSAWRDVSYELTAEGKMHFKGTAYFKNISKVHIGSDMKSDLVTEFVKKNDGSVELRMLSKKDKKGGKSAPVKMSEKELAEKIQAAKLEFQKGRQMMTMFFSGLRMEKIFHLPGDITKSNVFAKAGRTVSIVYEGEKMLKAFDEMAQSEEWWKKQVLSGKGGDNGPSSSEINEKLFGVKGTAYAVAGGNLRQVFDYNQEVKAAKTAYAAMRKKLGLPEGPRTLDPAKGGGFKKLYVGGVRIVYESDYETGVAPFHTNKGYALSLVGELPGAVLRIKEGSLTVAETDNGEDLLPEREWDRKLRSFNLSKDKGRVVFEVALNLPGKGAKGIKEVAGEIIYVVGAGTKEVNLGTLDLKTGTKGNALDASIASVAKSNWQKGHFEIKVKMKTAKDNVKAVRFYDVSGNEITVKESGYSGWGDNLTLNFSHEGALPAKAKIVVEMYANLQEFVIPFSVKNIDMLGMPVK